MMKRRLRFLHPVSMLAGGSLGLLSVALLSRAAYAAPAEDASAAAQGLTGTEVVGQVTLSLVLVVALLLLLAWGMRRLNRFQSQGSVDLRVVGGLTLGTREKILLVEAGDARLLVGVSPGGLSTLHVFPGEVGAARSSAGFGGAAQAGGAR